MAYGRITNNSFKKFRIKELKLTKNNLWYNNLKQRIIIYDQIANNNIR